MINYQQFPGLAGVYLEDSYVLEIIESPTQLTFTLDAVITPESPAYRPPIPGEQYCYVTARLVFSDVTEVDWVTRNERDYVDATGEHDLGNIDVLKPEGDWLVAEGDWGHVRIRGAQPYVELES